MAKTTHENPNLPSARPLGSAPDILEEGEAWCDDCRKVVFQLGPWQDICPCGAFLTRSGYDEEEITKCEAQNKEVSDAGPLTQPLKPKREPGIR